MVPSVTPRDRCERNLTHSKNCPGSRSKSPARSMRFTSSQVVFCVSQASVVSAPRTARAFSRAAFRQETIDDGLLSSLTMNSMTSLGVIWSYFLLYQGSNSLIESTPCQPYLATSADCGSSEVW
ncbi:hypothetical protein FQZ97_776950 [compost metagenome]